MKRLILVIAIIVIFAGKAAAVDITWTWTPPTYGSPAVSYVFQVSVDGAPFQTVATPATNQVTVAMETGTSIARVAGVDMFGRQGPWSLESEAFTDNGPPGAPGVPGWSIVAGALFLLGLIIFGAIRRGSQN